MANRSFGIWQGAVHALLLVALVACGSTDPPGDPASRADAALRLPKTLSIRIEPTGPHALLPSEGFGKAVAIGGARVAVADYLNWSYAGLEFPHVDTFELVESVAVPTGRLPTEGWGALCFGEAIGLSGDLLAIGEPCANGGAGAVHLYANVRGTWIEEPLLAPATGTARFGAAIAMAANRMVIGAPYQAVTLPGGETAAAGSVYVYSRSGGEWTLDARLTPADLAAGDAFGGAVSMDAARFAATAPGRWNGDAAGNALGANGKAYLFVLRPDGTWAEGASFVVGDGATGEWTGRTTALCSGTLFVGSSTWRWPAVHAFQEGPAGWTEGDLADPSPPPNGFVDGLSCDGATLVVGMPFSGAPEEGWIGTARVYKKVGGAWLPAGEVRGAAPGDRAGHAVAVDGAVVTVGIPSAIVGERALGVVRVERF